MKHLFPKDILLKIYNALFLPHLNYALLIWGINANRIFKIQKKVIRIISKAKYNAHTEPLFKNLELLKIEDLYKLHAAKFYYKSTNNKLPFYFYINKIGLSHGELHNVNTRQTQNIATIKVNHEFAKKCLRYSIAKIINDLPINIKSKTQSHSLFSFANHFKKYLINEYSLQCHQQNCYICNDNEIG